MAHNGGVFGFEFGFVHQHNRNVVADGINTVAVKAFQATAIGLQLDTRLTRGTTDNLQKVRTQTHWASLLERWDSQLRAGILGLWKWACQKRLHRVSQPIPARNFTGLILELARGGLYDAVAFARSVLLPA
jgi:hypothetical protein